MAEASPYFTELESARYCRCGVARLRSWEDRGYLTVRTDVDGRRFYVRDELDRVMQGIVDPEGAKVAGAASASAVGRAGSGPTAEAGVSSGSAAPDAKGAPRRPRAATKAAQGEPGRAKKPSRPALPFTDPEQDTRRRGGGGGR